MKLTDCSVPTGLTEPPKCLILNLVLLGGDSEANRTSANLAGRRFAFSYLLTGICSLLLSTRMSMFALFSYRAIRLAATDQSFFSGKFGSPRSRMSHSTRVGGLKHVSVPHTDWATAPLSYIVRTPAAYHTTGAISYLFPSKNLRHMLQKEPLRVRPIKHRLIFSMHPLSGFGIQPQPQPFLRGNAPLLAIRRCHLLENALLYQPAGDGGGTPS